MKNPLLSVLALIALAGILFAQAPPSSTSAHSIVRQVELVGPIRVEGIVPFRNHITIPWTAGQGSPFTWVCPAGMHARLTMNASACSNTSLRLMASGVDVPFPSGGDAVIHPGDTLTLTVNCSPNPLFTGILQLAVEYD
jgi:hypothetical protein